ncbi:MAG: tetratricopeptide repeat protein, partial [Bacilli bacterium]
MIELQTDTIEQYTAYFCRNHSVVGLHRFLQLLSTCDAQSFYDSVTVLAYEEDSGFPRVVGRFRLTEESEAIFQLGTDFYAKDDFVRAAACFLLAAHWGNSFAMVDYASMIATRLIPDEPHQFWLRWTVRAAQYRNPIALANLGMAYHYGWHVARNEERALSFLYRSTGMHRKNEARLREEDPNAQEAVRYYEDKQRDNYTEVLLTIGEITENLKKMMQAVKLGNGRAGEVLLNRFSHVLTAAQKSWIRSTTIENYAIGANHGFSSAMYSLAKLYEEGKFIDKDDALAFEWFTKAAEAGDHDAEVSLGLMYLNGVAVEKDLDEAEQWFQNAYYGNADGALKNLTLVRLARARENDAMEEVAAMLNTLTNEGDGEASYILADLYNDGVDFPENEKLAYVYYEQAANLGFAAAYVRMAELIETKEPEAAFRFYTKAANEGAAECYIPLAICYYEGNGVAQDFHAARGWFELALATEQYEALVHLGKMSWHGEGTPEDLNEAERYFIEAVKREDMTVYPLLGELYFEMDRAEDAVYVLQEGVANEDWDCAYLLGVYYMEMDDVDRAMEHFLMGAEYEHAESMYALGGVFEEIDITQAIDWWKRAAEYGHAEAAVTLANHYHLRGLYMDSAIYYERAIALGNTDVIGLCGDVYRLADDEEKALRFYELAAQNGDTAAKLSVLMTKIEEAEDHVTASKLFDELLAHAEGEMPGAWRAVGHCYAEGNGCEENVQKA